MAERGALVGVFATLRLITAVLRLWGVNWWGDFLTYKVRKSGDLRCEILSGFRIEWSRCPSNWRPTALEMRYQRTRADSPTKAPRSHDPNPRDPSL